MEWLAPGRAELDLARPETFEPWLSRCEAVVCAAGPFYGYPASLAAACLERGLPYLDFADDRAFVAETVRLAEERPPRALFCTAWSTACALTGALAALAAGGREALSIRSFMAPGNRGARGTATMASLLSSVGRFFPAGTRRVRGWSEPRIFPFPQPVGPRAGYLIDAADYDHLHAPLVEFRVGSEFPALNAACAGLGYAAEALSINWRAYARPLAALLRPLARFGTTAGAVGAEVETSAGIRRAVVLAERDAPRIALLPVVVMLERLEAGRAPPGLASWNGWIDRAGLERACARFGFRLSCDAG